MQSHARNSFHALTTTVCTVDDGLSYKMRRHRYNHELIHIFVHSAKFFGHPVNLLQSVSSVLLENDCSRALKPGNLNFEHNNVVAYPEILSSLVTFAKYPKTHAAPF